MTDDTDSHHAEGEDPFFRLPDDSQWNACIGRQGDEENYVDGYIEAAMALANVVIEKEKYGSRDTLVLPILYNTRHAVELLLKFAINKLHASGAIPSAHAKNHNILSHWTLLDTSALGDEALRQHVVALKPYVSSLARIDDDGQELRYSENRSGQKSLGDRSLANIEVIRSSLDRLSEVMEGLKYRVVGVLDERLTGTYTAACSRRDLLEIARMLPNRSEWTGPEFSTAKAAVLERFGLSGGQFSQAIKVIEGNREMRCRIGMPTSLAYLTDQGAIFAVEQWALRHPIRPSTEFGVAFGERDIQALTAYRQVAREANSRILERLKPDEIADLQAIFYMGRERRFCEYYERDLERAQKEHRLQGGLGIPVEHLMQKTNFKDAVASGVAKLGRPDLAEKLRQIQPAMAGSGAGWD